MRKISDYLPCLWWRLLIHDFWPYLILVYSYFSPKNLYLLSDKFSKTFQLILGQSDGSSSLKLLHIKVTLDLHLTYSKNGGKRVGIENEKYSLSLNFIDKTCKIYLSIFVLYNNVAFEVN